MTAYAAIAPSGSHREQYHSLSESLGDFSIARAGGRETYYLHDRSNPMVFRDASLSSKREPATAW
jgi:hypothetical protein